MNPSLGLVDGAGEDQASQLRQLVARARAAAAPEAALQIAAPPRPASPPARAAHAIRSAPAHHTPHPHRPVARIVAVASGKGGVGKTNLSVNLAIAMSRRGARVALLDGDIGLANADVVCGVTPHLNLSHVLEGKRTIEEILIPAPGGFLLAPGCSGLSRSLEAGLGPREDVLHRLEPLDRCADVIVLDCGAGISHPVMSLLRAADLGLIVTTPEPPAIADAYAIVKRLAQLGGVKAGGWSGVEPAIVVNQARDQREAEQTRQRLSAVAARFLGAPLRGAGWIPWDRAVAEAVRARIPVTLRTPRSPAAASISRLGEGVLSSLHVAAAATPARPGLVGRLFRPFGGDR